MSETEFLAYKNCTDSQEEKLNTFLSLCRVQIVDSRIARLAAEIRRTYNTKLGDSIIAATALFFSASLVTRNVADFRQIEELTVVEL